MPGVVKEAVIPIEGTLLTLASLLVAARLYLRVIRQRQALAVSDIILVASVVDAIALFICDNLAYQLGGMDTYNSKAPEPSVSSQIALMKVSFAGNYFYDTGIYFPKMALLAFYFKLIPSTTMPLLRKVLYGVTALTLTFAVTTCLLDTFWCGSNVAVNWSLEEGACNTFDSMEVFRIDWALNVVSDTLILALPFPLIYRLQLSRRQIIGLIATFSLGCITIGTSVGRFATVVITHAWTDVYVLSMTELAVAIMVVSLPSLKSLLHRRGMATQKYAYSGSGSGYGKHSANSNHYKLSLGRDKFGRPRRNTENECGSDVELNGVGRSNGIYKAERVSVSSYPADEEDRRPRLP